MPEFGPRPKQFSQAGASEDSRIRVTESATSGRDSPEYTLLGVIPIGGCIPYDPPTTGAPQPPLPFGWEYADGGTVTTVDSLKFGQTKPALMATVENPGTTKKFLRGADTTSPYGGGTLTTGGADTHGHTGGTSADGSHSHTAPAHTHPVTTTTSSTGSHTHTATVPGAGLGISLDAVVGATTNAAGTHSHTGSGTASSGGGGGTSSAGTHGHGIGTTADSNTPAFVEMAWIIRVL